jgi:flagellar biosynthetic protein FliP
MKGGRSHWPPFAVVLLGLGLALASGLCMAAEPSQPPFADLPARMGKELSSHQDWAPALRVVMVLTLLSLIPALLIATTAFLRIIVVLVLLRHAIGLQDAPPNMAVVTVALFMTLFAMLPTFSEIDEKAWRPYMEDRITLTQAAAEGKKPLRDFMLRQTREQDLSLVVELSKSRPPQTEDDVGLLQLIPAFMLSELRMAFQIGFIIFLPFLVVDLVVSSVLAALGMMMVPPVMISLPLKILLFVLIDGWNLVARALVGSFH